MKKIFISSIGIVITLILIILSEDPSGRAVILWFAGIFLILIIVFGIIIFKNSNQEEGI
jgi:phosphate starvation-inducible membrane PsiE